MTGLLALSCQLVFHDIKIQKAYLVTKFVGDSQQAERNQLSLDRPKIQNGLDKQSSGLKINLIQL